MRFWVIMVGVSEEDNEMVRRKVEEGGAELVVRPGEECETVRIEGIIKKILDFEIKKREKLPVLSIFDRSEIRKKIVEFSESGYTIPEIREVLESLGLRFKSYRVIADVLHKELGDEKYRQRYEMKYLLTGRGRKPKVKEEPVKVDNTDNRRERKKDDYDDFFVGG